MCNPCKVTVVIRFQICIFDTLNTAKNLKKRENETL